MQLELANVPLAVRVGHLDLEQDLNLILLIYHCCKIFIYNYHGTYATTSPHKKIANPSSMGKTSDDVNKPETLLFSSQNTLLSSNYLGCKMECFKTYF